MDQWVCSACELGVHARCFGSAACECACLHPPEHWLSPERRAELRQIASEGLFTLHLPAHEQAFITRLLAHRADRQEAEARRA